MTRRSPGCNVFSIDIPVTRTILLLYTAKDPLIAQTAIVNMSLCVAVHSDMRLRQHSGVITMPILHENAIIEDIHFVPDQRRAVSRSTIVYGRCLMELLVLNIH